MTRTAVVLFNLGGPDRLEAVRPFLFNLFNDPAIINLPAVARWPLAQLISRRRAPTAREIYENLGGGSPLLPNTEAQARALEARLGPEYRCFIAMRYWHPLTEQAVRDVEAWAPDRIVLCPLYPQFSSTTTGSSLSRWSRLARDRSIPTVRLCCWPTETGLVTAVARQIAAALDSIGEAPRLLFSAHGLPEKIVAKGDPYQWQVEQTVAAVMAELAQGGAPPDHVICYQSRVGPLAWIKPATEAEIRRAGADRRAVILIPIAFVSEHSETLVELDIEYRHIAEQAGVGTYRRLPTVSIDPGFIDGLADLIRRSAGCGADLTSQTGSRICPTGFALCPWKGTVGAPASPSAPARTSA